MSTCLKTTSSVMVRGLRKATCSWRRGTPAVTRRVSTTFPVTMKMTTKMMLRKMVSKMNSMIWRKEKMASLGMMMRRGNTKMKMVRAAWRKKRL